MSVGPYQGKPLVFDIGAHLGADTAYYLSQGFKVVAVEAHPELAKKLAWRLNRTTFNGLLNATVVNKAITPYGLDASLFVSKDTTRETHSIHPEKVKNPCDIPYRVSGTTIPELIVEYGLPKFIKLDIEGMDVVAIREMHEWCSKRKVEAPEWLSVELDRDDPIAMLELFMHLGQMGYTGFNLVSQAGQPKGTSGKLPWECCPMEYDLEGVAGAWFDTDWTEWDGGWWDLHARHKRATP